MEETWKPIKGYEGLYEVSNFGRIKALEKRVDKGKCHRSWKEHFLKYVVDQNGYFRTNLSKNGTNKTVKVHRIVAETFVENLENKKTVNHIDGNKQNNKVENLEWATQSENMKHACQTKLKLLNGEHNPSSKLTYEDVCFIRNNYIPRDPVYGTIGLSKRFNVHRKTISRIINFIHWKEGENHVKRKII